MAQIDITKQRMGMFVHALADAEPGDEIIYHLGEYAGGCHKHDAAAAAEAKLCILYQRRAEKLFAYIARKPHK